MFAPDGAELTEDVRNLKVTVHDYIGSSITKCAIVLLYYSDGKFMVIEEGVLEIYNVLELLVDNHSHAMVSVRVSCLPFLLVGAFLMEILELLLFLMLWVLFLNLWPV